MNDERFETLLAELFDGGLTPPDAGELLDAVSDNPANSRRLLTLLCLEPLLADWTRTDEAGEGFVRRVQQALEVEEESAAFTRGVLEKLSERDRPPTPPALRKRRRLLLATAAIVLVCFGVFLTWSSREQPTASIAHLESVQGEVYVVTGERDARAIEGQVLLSGQGVRTVGEDSTVIVRFADTTRMELGLNSSIRLDRNGANREVFLAEGALTAEIPPQAEEPMVVATFNATVTLPDTPTPKSRFRLSSAPGSMQIELESGSVAVTRRSDRKSVRLNSGELMMVTTGEGLLAPHPRVPRPGNSPLLLGRHKDRITSLTFTPDGKTLASGSADGTVILWTIPGGQRREFLSRLARVSPVAFSPDGKALAVTVSTPNAGAGAAVVELWDVQERQKKADFPGIFHVNELSTVAFTPDGKAMASVDPARNIHLWNTATRERKATYRTRKGRILCLAFSADGRDLTAAEEYGQLTTWRLLSERPPATVRLEYFQGDRLCAAFSPDRRKFVTGTLSGIVQVWESEAGKLLATLHGHRSAVYCVAFSSDGKMLATGSRDGTTRLWDVATARELAAHEGGGSYVRSVVFSPDRTLLAIGSNDGSVKLWDIAAPRRE